MDTTIRLNKYLANLGLCSRRNVKQLLQEKTVTVNGKEVKEAGIRVDPQCDDIRVDGKKIKKPQLYYYIINKPKGIISTTADEFGRKNVTSLIPVKEKIFPVGRLDKDTTGILILTNDGTLTNLLTHPKYHVDKVYRLTIAGRIEQPQLTALRRGVLLDDGMTSPAQVKIIKESHTISIIEMTIHEGRNRQIRRMCETVGVPLRALKRIYFGPISLGNLKEGTYRTLTHKEVIFLRKAASLAFQADF